MDEKIPVLKKPILSALEGNVQKKQPIWLMRQAGRHLPEYREIRAKAGDFLSLVTNPTQAAEVTLQPVRKYGMDGSILFSDILVVPWAMGQGLRFEAGEGPKLDPMPDVLEKQLDVLLPIYETLRILSSKLENTSVTQIGFVGAPWTVATYMIEQGKPSFQKSRDFLVSDRSKTLFKQIIKVTIAYARAQVKAGAEVIKIFDSWAGQLLGSDLHKWSYEPMAEIGAALAPTPVIYFPRGGENYLQDLTTLLSGNYAFALGQNTSITQVREAIGPGVCLQGNLNPDVLINDEAKQEEAVKQLLSEVQGTPHIVNLGHGVRKDTNPKRVQALVDQIKAG
ncbi:MAG: uroporphyrinogen decarboxylase [Alphaproteobacteria bacterium]